VTFTWTLLLAVGSFFSYFRKISVEKLDLFITLSIKKKVFQELLSKNMKFFNTSHSGRLSMILNKDIKDFCSVLTVQAATFLRGFIFCVISSVLLLFDNFGLLFIGSFPLFLLIYTGRRVAAALRKRQFELTSLKGQQNAYTSEVLRQIKTVKLFQSESQELSRYSSTVQKINEKSIQLSHDYSRFFSAIELFIEATVICGLGLGIYVRNFYPDLKLEDFSSTGVYLIYGGFGFRLMLSSYSELQKALGLFEGIKNLYQNESRESFNFEDSQIDSVLPDLEIENLRFSYNDEEVIKGINLKVNPGQILAIVGESGNGKTTIFNLITNLYRPTHGKILINGENIFEHKPSWVRKQLAVVTQEGLLFSGTILDNIIYNSRKQDNERLEKVCKETGIMKFIDHLPEGFLTNVGENGISLSGGQRQRICIARALYKNSKILLLDEATSGLDARAEKKIQKVVENAARSRRFTVLIITHRVSSLKNLADWIVFLDKGRIRAQGTFNELISDDSEFRLLANI
jgi:ABC-type multidrug transport system fused ATPase/permease subunit